MAMFNSKLLVYQRVCCLFTCYQLSHEVSILNFARHIPLKIAEGTWKKIPQALSNSENNTS